MSPVPKEILNQHIAVLGKTRSGKSSVMRGLVEGLLERELPVCIVDPKGDWYGIKLAADGKRPGYPVVIFGGEHADIPINEHAGAHVAELFATGNRPCLIDLGGWMVAPRTRFWIDFASTLFKHTKGQRWLVVDEVHNFCPKGSLKGAEGEMPKALHWTNRLASEGLGKGLAMIFASQRPQKVHNDTLTSAETLIAMRVLHPSDRGAVAEWIKGCGDSEGSEVLNSLAQMERGEGWVWSPEIGFGPKRVKFPMFKTYDSFRPQSIEDAKKLKGWAEVDLDDVRVKMAATIEKAKADDPRELRKQIKALEMQVAGKALMAVAAHLDNRRVKVPVLTDADRDLLGRLWARLSAFAEPTAGSIDKLVATITKHVESTSFEQRTILVGVLESKGFQKILSKLATLAQQMPPPQVERTTPARHQVRPAGRVLLGGSSNRARPAGGDEAISRAHQKILNGLAFLHGIGVNAVDKTQLALIVGVSPTSGGYFNNLGALRSAGLIEYPTGGTVALTAAGGALASSDGVPSTTAELHDAIQAKLAPAKWKILEALIAIYPKSLTKDTLAEQIGVSPTSGGYFNNLGSLRSLGLIAYPRPSEAAAQPVLFLEN